MYDSSKTKLIKLVFDNNKVINLFVDLTMELQSKNHLDKYFPAQLQKIYLQYKKVFRDKFFKKFCDQYKLLSDKKGIESENKEIVNALKEIMIEGIKIFANEFTNNRILEDKAQKSLKLICHRAAEQTINIIANNPIIADEIKKAHVEININNLNIIEHDLVSDKV